MSEAAAITGNIATKPNQATGAGEMRALTLSTHDQVSFQQDL